MRKTYFVLLVFLLTLTGCGPSNKTILNETFETIIIPEVVTQDLDLKSEYTYGGKTISAKWESSDEDILTNLGKVTKANRDQEVTLTLTLTLGGETLIKQLDLTVPAITREERVEYASTQVSLPKETKDDLDLINDFQGVTITWKSNNTRVISNKGKVSFVDEETEVVLTATFSVFLTSISKDYVVKVLPLTTAEKLNYAIEKVEIPAEVSFDISLPINFDFGIDAKWKSNKPEIISSSGIVNLTTNIEEVTLTLTLHLEGETMNKTFNVRTVALTENHFTEHLFLLKANEINTNKLDNLTFNNNSIVLKDNNLEGYYESETIYTHPFKSLVVSWGAITSTTSTAEVLIKVLIDGKWSEYLSYQPWGFGRENKTLNQNSTLVSAKLEDDIVFITDDKVANAFQLKIILRKDNDEVNSPKFNFVSVALEIPNYNYVISDELPSFVDYDVPKLNQNIVPEIGNSICSPTSITMLLKHKGVEFANTGYDFEHQYMAHIVRDYRSKIFGNWVYNTVAASSYGYESYVKRMYSFEELQHHLANYGPVAASVKGDMQGNYYTNGHLIVVRGYRTENGKTVVITNDPNLKDVYFEYDLDVFMNVWRNIVYVI